MNKEDRTKLLEMLALNENISILSNQVYQRLSQVIEQPDYVDGIKTMISDLDDKTKQLRSTISSYNPDKEQTYIEPPEPSEPAFEDVEIPEEKVEEEEPNEEKVSQVVTPEKSVEHATTPLRQPEMKTDRIRK